MDLARRWQLVPGHGPWFYLAFFEDRGRDWVCSWKASYSFAFPTIPWLAWFSCIPLGLTVMCLNLMVSVAGLACSVLVSHSLLTMSTLPWLLTVGSTPRPSLLELLSACLLMSYLSLQSVLLDWLGCSNQLVEWCSTVNTGDGGHGNCYRFYICPLA